MEKSRQCDRWLLDLRGRFRQLMRSPENVEAAAAGIVATIIEETILGVMFDVHRAVKTGTLFTTVTQHSPPLPQPTIADNLLAPPPLIIGGDHPSSKYTTSSSTTNSRWKCGAGGSEGSSSAQKRRIKKLQLICCKCQLPMTPSYYTKHLEKCLLGMEGDSSRQSARVARQKIANTCKKSNFGGNTSDDDFDDEDNGDAASDSNAGSSGRLKKSNHQKGSSSGSRKKQHENNNSNNNRCNNTTTTNSHSTSLINGNWPQGKCNLKENPCLV